MSVGDGSGEREVVVVAGRLLDPSVPQGTDGTCAIRIRGRRIVDVVGPDGGRDADTAVIDLSGRTVLPGFFDAHNHQPSAARDALEVSTSHVTSLEELAQALRSEREICRDGEWIVTERSLSRAQLRERRFPTARELDAVSEQHPIVVRFGAHAAALNTMALAMSGLAGLRADPPAGRLERDSDGVPLGPIHEYGAIARVEAQRGRTDEREHVRALAAIQLRYAATGITSVRVPGVRPGELAWYQRLRDRGEPLVNRIFAAVRLDPNLSQREKLEVVAGWEVRTGFGDEWLRIDALKIFVDGGVGEDPDKPAELYLSLRDLTELVDAATARGWSVACHANTSAAVAVVLGAYEKVRHQARPQTTLAIEHGLYMTDEQLEKAHRFKVWLSTQPALLEVNSHLLAVRAGGAAGCPLRSALRSGVRVALGSDWNATPGTHLRPYAPLRSLALATGEGPERIPPRTALRLHTRGPAELVGHRSLGRIAPGAPADLIAFDGLRDASDLTADGGAVPSDVIVAGRQLVADGAVHAGGVPFDATPRVRRSDD